MTRLKVKLLKLMVGKPIAILHKEFADKASIHHGERVRVNKGNRKITAVVDTATGLLNKHEVVLSNEITEKLKLKEKDKVNISITSRPSSVSLIYKKLEGHRLNYKEIKKIIDDIVQNNLTEAEIAFFISGVFKEGMTMKETSYMTKAMVNTGKRLKLKGKIVDKHSIGGVPGRTSPILVSICSAAGLKMPKTSSRGITSPAGTADAMETICKVDFNFQEMKKLLNNHKSCLVWGGKLNLAPADGKIIQVEKLLSLDPVPQLLASILAKKMSVDANHILINIPYGKYAKVTKQEAKKLKRKFYKLAKYFNLKIKCVLTKVREPYGNGIGPTLEMRDVIKVLKREDSCHNLEKNAVRLAGQILEMTNKAKDGKKKAQQILDSGQAFEEFKKIVNNQEGKIKKLKLGKHKKAIHSPKNGRIKNIDIRKINNIARMAGCPLDKKAGILLNKHLNDKVNKDDKLLTIYAESSTELNNAVNQYKKEKPIEIKC